MRVNDAPFGDGEQAETFKAAGLLQVGEKIVGEELLARPGALGTEMGEIFGAEMGLAHPLNQPSETSTDAVAGPVQAIVGIAAEEMVKLGRPFVQALAKIELGHAQLVLISEEDALGSASFVCSHRVPRLFGSAAPLGRAALLLLLIIAPSRTQRRGWGGLGQG